ncbi:MAG: IS91 family transposase [Bacteroidota bacterium]|nr:IS91 family transposase [Bacteroidota bacterium]
MRPAYEVADVLRRNQDHLGNHCANTWQLRTLNALAACRTQALGYHVDKCTNPGCGAIHITYNSCRNRHCPKCQGHKREQWINKRESELIKAAYYHVVFTLPDDLNRLCLHKPSKMYALLFKTAWSVIKDFAANPKFLGAKTGIIAILHTWGQNLTLHPHLHCIVPGGGITPSKKWKPAKGKGKYLFPVKAMAKVFRARYVEGLREITPLDQRLSKHLFAKPWMVYCKRPFFGPEQVVEYLGRYTHKIAISNHRIKNIDNGQVTFTAKDYRHAGKVHMLNLSDSEFIRRFSLHILPRGFTRIRHYGFLSNSLKNAILPILQQEVGKPQLPEKPPLKHKKCCFCGIGQLVTIMVYSPRGPPAVEWAQGFASFSFSN